jgi:glutamate 5-kinase
VLIDLLDKNKEFAHTYFVPSKKPSSGIKKWIGYSDDFTKGQVVINNGACKALVSKNAVSLLPVGVIEIVSDFKKGDLIKIMNESGSVIGIGKAQYGSDKIKLEMDSEKQKPLVHYDYLYIENKNSSE